MLKKATNALLGSTNYNEEHQKVEGIVETIQQDNAEPNSNGMDDDSDIAQQIH